MKKIFLSIFFILSLFLAFSVSAAALEGGGTEANPYVLETETDLSYLSLDSDAYFVLANDISLSENWTPVQSFSGELDGKGNKITNLNIEDTEDVSTGFILTNSGKIKNLHICGGETGIVNFASPYSSEKDSGGIAAVNFGEIYNSSFTGSIYYPCSGYSVGGIVGTNSGKILNSFSDVKIMQQGGSVYVGGLIGCDKGLTYGCRAKAVIENIESTENSFIGQTCIGGLIGWKDSSIPVCYSYAESTITSNTCYWGQYAGGLIGKLSRASLYYCYAKTSIKLDTYRLDAGEMHAAGLVGAAITYGYGGDYNIYSCYAEASELDVTYTGNAYRTGYVLPDYYSGAGQIKITDYDGDENIFNADKTLKNTGIIKLSTENRYKFYMDTQSDSDYEYTVEIEAYPIYSYLGNEVVLTEKSGDNIGTAVLDSEYNYNSDKIRLIISPESTGEKTYTIKNAEGTASVDVTVEISDSEYFYEVKEDGTAEITSYNKKDNTAPVIPKEIDGIKVTGIADGAFKSQILQITVYDNVKTIGENAFLSSNSFTMYAYPESAAASYAGANTKITYLELEPFEIFSDEESGEVIIASVLAEETLKFTIPENITKILSAAFLNRSDITDITFLSENTEIEEGAFEYLSKNCTIHAPKSSSAFRAAEALGLKTAERLPESFDYTVSDGEVYINSLNYSDDYVLLIPESHEGMPVTGISFKGIYNSLYYDSSLFIPECITKIEYSEYGYFCPVNSVDIVVISGSAAEARMLEIIKLMKADFEENSYSEYDVFSDCVISADDFSGHESIKASVITDRERIIYDAQGFECYVVSESHEDGSGNYIQTWYYYGYDEDWNYVKIYIDEEELGEIYYVSLSLRDGKALPESFTVPAKVNGKLIQSCYGELYSGDAELDIKLSEGITENIFGGYIDFKINKLTLPKTYVSGSTCSCAYIEVSENNSELSSENGLLYNKEGTRIYQIPSLMEAIVAVSFYEEGRLVKCQLYGPGDYTGQLDSFTDSDTVKVIILNNTEKIKPLGTVKILNK